MLQLMLIKAQIADDSANLLVLFVENVLDQVAKILFFNNVSHSLMRSPRIAYWIIIFWG